MSRDYRVEQNNDSPQLLLVLSAGLTRKATPSEWGEGEGGTEFIGSIGTGDS